MSTTQQPSSGTVTIAKEEYQALLHTARVTSEYLKGKSKTFSSAEELIKNLKNLA